MVTEETEEARTVKGGRLRVLPGDIVLLSGTRKVSHGILLAQKLIGKPTRFSHCAICFHGNLWVHATPNGGVTMTTTTEIFLSGQYGDNWRLFRHDGAAGAAQKMEEDTEPGSVTWIESAMQSLGQRYNYFIGVPKARADRTKFCSELVVSVLETAGHRLVEGASATSVVPGSLEQLLTRSAKVRDISATFRASLQAAQVRELKELESDDKELLMARHFFAGRVLTQFLASCRYEILVREIGHLDLILHLPPGAKASRALDTAKLFADADRARKNFQCLGWMVRHVIKNHRDWFDMHGQLRLPRKPNLWWPRSRLMRLRRSLMTEAVQELRTSRDFEGQSRRHEAHRMAEVNKSPGWASSHVSEDADERHC